jgi:hypothetical protein
MPSITLDLADAAELGQLLGFLTDWLLADRTTLDASLGRFVGHPGYHVDELRRDLHRFGFLLDETDGQDLFRS